MFYIIITYDSKLRDEYIYTYSGIESIPLREDDDMRITKVYMWSVLQGNGSLAVAVVVKTAGSAVLISNNYNCLTMLTTHILPSVK